MAKSIRKKSERETLKERRRSGEFKQDKKDARDSGLSRREARKRAKRLSNVEALSKRKEMRADMATKRKDKATAKEMYSDVRRMDARSSGNSPSYDRFNKDNPNYKEGRYEGKPKEVIQKIRRTSGAFNDINIKEEKESKRRKDSNIRSFKNQAAMKKAKTGEFYTITTASGEVKKLKKAMYGAKVKAVKKAPGGAAMKNMPTYKKGGALKSVPSKSKGLSKLPKGVRNKMGYMQEGGKVKSKSFGVLKSDANKTGPKMEEGKKPFTKNGITYTWDRKNSVWMGDLDKKKSRAVKKK